MMKSHLPHGSHIYEPAEGDIICYKLYDSKIIRNDRIVLLVKLESARYQFWICLLDGELASLGVGFSINMSHIDYVKVYRCGQPIIDWRRI